MTRLSGLLCGSLIALVATVAALVVPGLPGGSGAPASAATPAQQIGMKVLLITDSSDNSTASGIAYQDWVNTLKREGVPFTSVVTNGASPGSVPLPQLSSTQANGTQVANYEGVVVATSGAEGLSAAQWTALQTFEQHFSVRQLTAYAVPSADYGLSPPGSSSSITATTPRTLTAAGAAVFPYLKSVALDAGSFEYEGSPLAGAKVDTLISGPNSSTLLGVYTSADGRQTMFQTFNQNQFLVQSGLLRHGELAWLARNTYFGDQRNYLETNIDDNFLADDTWSVAGNANTAAHSTDFTAADALREVPADVTKAAQWSAANHFRIDMLFNGGGSVQYAAGCTESSSGDAGTGGTSTDCTGAPTGTDPLLSAFQANDPATGKPYTNDFYWINHTWDHPNIDQGCATQNYIEAEVNQNTSWGSKAASAGNPNTGGLGLTSSTDPTAALGSENPNAIITGEHSGLANLLPGNPGQVDPPALDTATPAATGGTLTAGQYVYAVSDQFNLAPPGSTPSAGTGESAASVSSPVSVTGATGSVALTWGAVCKAADYIIYRAQYTPPIAPATTGTVGAWSQIGTVPTDTTSDFTDPSGNSTTDTAGGGAVTKTFTDNGSTGTLAPAGKPQNEGTAVETPYEQNPNLDAAFAGTLDGGIKYFAADASKPYPSPADASFATGGSAGSQVAAGSTFSDAGGTAIPRYPTNIYYNVSTNAQEVDEYQTLYDLPSTGGSGACKPIAGVTTCNPAGTTFTIAQIIASVDQGMFQHMLGNDPRPHYFHQTNLMSSTTSGATGNGDGLFYETVDPLLAQYNQYFAANAPIEQPTMAQIGTLLSEQAGWATANASQVTGSINGNVVTVNNGGAAIEMPLTGIKNVGSAYAGSQSGWTLAQPGTSTYTALAAWPAPPAVPVVVTPPKGPAPSGHPAPSPKKVKPVVPPQIQKTPPLKKTVPTSVVVQVAPKTVHVKRESKVTVSLKCKAAKGQSCIGSFTLTPMGQKVTHRYRIKASKIARITVKLPKKARLAEAKATKIGKTGKRHHRTLHAKLVMSTKQTRGKAKVTRGMLNIKL